MFIQSWDFPLQKLTKPTTPQFDAGGVLCRQKNKPRVRVGLAPVTVGFPLNLHAFLELFPTQFLAT